MTEYIKRAQLKELLVTAGTQMLLDDGMRCGFGHVTLQRVFDQIEAETGRRFTLSSVYDRLWRNQEQYQYEILATVIEDLAPINPGTLRRVNRVLRGADTTTPAGRLAGLRALCQLAVQQHIQEISRDPHYRLVMAALAALAATNDPDPEPPHVTRVRHAIAAYLEHETDLYLDLLGMTSRVGPGVLV